MEESSPYSKGDWIVHSHYGIGQIKGIEVKGISGEETQYYRVKTTDSAFWMPIDKMDSELLRPLSSPEEIERAIDTLGMPAKEMSSNFKARQNRINRDRNRNTPRAIARLVRDLQGRQRAKGPLNGTELSALRALKQRFVEEWAIVSGAETETVESWLDRVLNPDPEESNGGNGKAKETKTANPASATRKQKDWRVWPRRQTNAINR
jgi:CarD family transcriptional regulator